MFAESTKLYDIPLSHLDYKYITECNKLKELETILKVLRSGTEGRFPDLERHCEDKIQSLDNDNRLLRRSGKLLSMHHLSNGEREEIGCGFQEWVSGTKTLENMVGDDESVELSGLPKVREWGSINVETGKGTRVKAAKHNAGKPRTYDEWAKIEKELDKELQDEENGSGEVEANHRPSGDAADGALFETSSVKPSCRAIREKLATMSKGVRSIYAQHEKDKGNEALITGDFNEALGYYERSLLYEPTPAVFNNRALLYLKQRKFKFAVEDCNRVLREEPENIKALLRRSKALYELHSLENAQQDLQRVLVFEPGNAKAMALLKTVKEERANRQKSRLEGGRRLFIDETDSEEDDKEKDEVSSGESDASYYSSSAQSERDDIEEDRRLEPERGAIRDDTPQERGVIIEEIVDEPNPPAPKIQKIRGCVTKKSQRPTELSSTVPNKGGAPEEALALTEKDGGQSIEMPELEKVANQAAPSSASSADTEKLHRKRTDLIRRLKDIGKNRIQFTIGIKLDAEMLEDHIFALNCISLPQRDFEFIYNVLDAITQSSRFNVACLLMKSSAVKALAEIFDELHNSPLSTTRNIAELQTQFSI